MKWKQFPLLILALLTPSWSGVAAEIAEVEVIQQGRFPLKEETLLYNIQQRSGAEFNPAVMREDIARLKRSGFFADVVAESVPQADGRVNVVYTVTLNPEVVAVVLEGNQKFSNAELLKYISVVPGTTLNHKMLQDSAMQLRTFYTDEGYFEARISPVLENAGENKVQLRFYIEEHLRYKVNSVNFVGVEALSERELRNVMVNRHSYFSFLTFLGQGLYNSAELELDKMRLRECYWNAGYLDFTIEDTQISQQEEDPELVDILFTVSEGEPYTVGTIDITGVTVADIARILDRVEMESGTLFDFRQEQTARQKILELYNSFGYADASVKVERNADFSSHVVNLNFVVSEGREYHVNNITITGNNFTKEKVIRRELLIHDGDPLDAARIEGSRNRLLGMGYFDQVDPLVLNSDTVGKRDVNFDVVEKEFYTFKIGAGYSDFNSLSGMLEIANINADITDYENYFLGGGQRIRLRGIGGLDRSMADFNFTEPWLFDIPLRLDLSVYWNQVEFDHWDEDRIGGSVSLSKGIFDPFTTITGGYRLEHVDLHHMSHKRSAEMRDLQAHDWVSKVSLLLERDTRDSLMDPTSGYQIGLYGENAMKIWASSHNFYRLEGYGSYYHNFFDKAIVWHIGGKIGVIQDYDGDKTVPLYERYFLGGGNSLRGFPYRSVSPVDSREDAIGGSSMLLLTTEVSHPIWNYIRGAFFVDAGGVWEDPYQWCDGSFNVGIGYGLRLKVPYLNAPIKLDLAYPVVNGVDGLDSKLRFHFNMGFTWNPGVY